MIRDTDNLKQARFYYCYGCKKVVVKASSAIKCSCGTRDGLFIAKVFLDPDYEITIRPIQKLLQKGSGS